jgi:hypothetical protein
MKEDDKIFDSGLYGTFPNANIAPVSGATQTRAVVNGLYYDLPFSHTQWGLVSAAVDANAPWWDQGSIATTWYNGLIDGDSPRPGEVDNNTNKIRIVYQYIDIAGVFQGPFYKDPDSAGTGNGPQTFAKFPYEVNLTNALESSFNIPAPLNDTSLVDSNGRGGLYSLSAANNSMALLSASSFDTFSDDPVVGLLFNNLPAASGAHVNTHHLEDPETGGGVAGVNKYAAATIRFAGNYFNGAEDGKHRKIALVTKKGNTVTYTINKHESAHGRHTFTATGSGGSDFSDSKNNLGSNGESGAVGPDLRRLKALGYR